MNNYEILQASGNLDIIKIYNSGIEETIFSDHNTITSGLGVSLATVFVGSGGGSIKNHQIRWFQLGGGDVNAPAWPGSYDASQNRLLSPLSSLDYGNTIEVDYHEIAAADGSKHHDQSFAWIPQSVVRKTSPTSVTYFLNIDKNSCNNITLREIGLFVHNPFQRFIDNSTIRSVLAAYRQFAPITKTDEFSLLFRWTLSF